MSESIESIIERRLACSKSLYKSFFPSHTLADDDFRIDYIPEYSTRKYQHYLIRFFSSDLQLMQDSLTFDLPHGRHEQFYTDHTKLYHYTTIHGLKGIIDNNFIWMNDTKYMNDSSEIVYQGDMFASVLNEYKNKYISDKLITKLLNDIEKEIGIPQKSMPYIACFSHDGDNLSLWRAYGNTGGFSIGFDMTTKYDFNNNPDCVFIDMEYREDIHKKLISVILDHAIKIINEDIIKNELLINDIYSWNIITEKAIIYIRKALRRMKNPFFKDECETRLVLKKEDLPKGTLKFRTKGNLLIPYYEKRAVINKKIVKRLPIFKVIVGPCAEQELVQSSIKEFLASRGYGKVLVENSKIPYRQI